MPEIHLTGLQSRSSLSYRAALGLLQAVQEIPQMAGSKLSWTSGYNKHAVLTTEAVELEEMLDLLDDFYAVRVDDPRWRASGGKEGKKRYQPNHTMTRERYREMVREFESHPHRLAWIRGSATDQAKHPTKTGSAMYTGWDTCRGGSLTSIHSKAVEVLGGIAKHSKRREAIATTLLGPWARQDDMNSMGWDERQIMSNARLGTSTSNLRKTTELMAMVFAIESLATYPVNARDGKARTAGMDGRQVTWVTWEKPVGYETVVAIVDHPLFHQKAPDPSVLGALGVTGLYRCYLKRNPNTQGKTDQVTRSFRVF